jgi:uncharacterized membrane protein YjjP (DUF1212 family)
VPSSVRNVPVKKKAPKPRKPPSPAINPPPALLHDALEVALYAGELLLRNGAETWRVEDTVVRLLLQFGAKESDVIATVTGIYISASDGAQWLTRVRRVRPGGIHLARIDAINALSRRTIEEQLRPALVQKELRAIGDGTLLYTIPSQIAAGLVTAAGFTFLFGGAWRELLACLPGALVITLVAYFLPRLKVPALAITGVASLAGVLASIPFGQWLDTGRMDVVILSTVVLLVPGATIVSAISDLLGGQLLSGLARGAAAILTASAIAAGVIVGLAMTGTTL